mgnify:CR=1 FL=1
MKKSQGRGEPGGNGRNDRARHESSTAFGNHGRRVGERGTEAVAPLVGRRREHPELREFGPQPAPRITGSVSYTHLRAHETVLDLVCRLLLENKKTHTQHTHTHTHTKKKKTTTHNQYYENL